jgi:hypothetical protein
MCADASRRQREVRPAQDRELQRNGEGVSPGDAPGHDRRAEREDLHARKDQDGRAERRDERDPEQEEERDGDGDPGDGGAKGTREPLDAGFGRQSFQYWTCGWAGAAAGSGAAGGFGAAATACATAASADAGGLR